MSKRVVKLSTINISKNMKQIIRTYLNMIVDYCHTVAKTYGSTGDIFYRRYHNLLLPQIRHALLFQHNTTLKLMGHQIRSEAKRVLLRDSCPSSFLVHNNSSL